MLLLCFVAGQYVVYTHTHSAGTGSNKSTYHSPQTQPKQTVTENCQLCDAMHHNSMAISTPAVFAPVVVSSYFYKAITHHFISVALILSAGRSPPVA
jgi:hypothetical protein